MRTLIFILFLPLIVNSQIDCSDTITVDYRTYANITADTIFEKDTFIIFEVIFTDVNKKYVISQDTIDEKDLLTFVDSLIVLNQSDSIQYNELRTLYYNQFRDSNTKYLNKKNLLNKLWAIRPED